MSDQQENRVFDKLLEVESKISLLHGVIVRHDSRLSELESLAGNAGTKAGTKAATLVSAAVVILSAIAERLL